MTYKQVNMKTNEPIEERLWDYIDGRCTPAERSAIDGLLATNREWQQRYKELLNLDQLLQTQELDAPSMRFTTNVMETIARHQVAPATRSYINKNIIRGIAAFFLTLIGGFIIFALATVKWTGTGENKTVSNLLPSPDQGIEKLGTALKIFNGTYFSLIILISVIMGLVLLDLYLQRRRSTI